MIVPILCLIALFFLSWVIVLKAEIQGLKEDKRRMQAILDRNTSNMTRDVEAGGGRRLTGSEVAHAERKALSGRPSR
jgi:hypothetical protein